MNIIKTWQQKARKNGTTLTAICKALNIRYTVIGKWKKEIPRSVQIYREIEEALSNNQKLDQ